MDRVHVFECDQWIPVVHLMPQNWEKRRGLEADWHGYPANSERLEVAACLGEEMASSMHNEETGGKFQCPIPSG